jgi:hypothetical protein
MEFHANNAALRKEPRDFAGQNTGPTGLFEDSVRCLRNFLDNLAFPPSIEPERCDAGNMIIAPSISRKKRSANSSGRLFMGQTPTDYDLILFKERQLGPTKEELNFLLSVVRGIYPRDETEALIAVQMAAIDNATMAVARRLNRVETISQQDSASTMLNKLARTFAVQFEALKKYRSTGEQTIKVQHVTVNDGGHRRQRQSEGWSYGDKWSAAS